MRTPKTPYDYFSKIRRIMAWVTADTWKHIKDAHLSVVSGHLAYISLLSIIPILAVGFAVFQAFQGPELIYSNLQKLFIENLAEGTGKEAMISIQTYISNANTQTLGIGGLLGMFVTCISLLSNAEHAINRVWGTEVSRSLFRRITAYWFFISFGPLGLAIILGMASSQKIAAINLIPRGVTAFLLITIGLTFIYKYVPHRKVNWLPAILSGLFGSALFTLTRAGYQIYNNHVITYHKVYGSLGAVPIILIWIYLIWLVLLSGAALTASLQKGLNKK